MYPSPARLLLLKTFTYDDIYVNYLSDTAKWWGRKMKIGGVKSCNKRNRSASTISAGFDFSDKGIIYC